MKTKMVNWMEHSRRAKRHTGRRVLSALLALVMVLGLTELALPEARADVERTNFVIYHHYLSGGNSPNEEGYIDPDGTVHLWDDSADEWILYASGAPYYRVDPQPKMEGDNVLETFSGFSVEKGDAAVTLPANNLVSGVHAEIRYEPGTPEVVIHVYYRYNVDYFGVNFATKGLRTKLSLPADQDVVVVTDDNLDTIKSCDPDNLEGLEEGDWVYDTSAGLHTNKYISVDSTYTGGRTFDMTLEAWYAKDNPTDVGFILDASGSMAFLDKNRDSGIKGIAVWGGA